MYVHVHQFICHNNLHNNIDILFIMKEKKKLNLKKLIVIFFITVYLSVSMRAVIGQFSAPYSPVQSAKI